MAVSTSEWATDDRGIQGGQGCNDQQEEKRGDEKEETEYFLEISACEVLRARLGGG